MLFLTKLYSIDDELLIHRFKHGFVLGGLVCALLSGRPSPGSPIRKFLTKLALTPAEHPTLHYFDIRGRAEAIRIALVDQGVDFKDSSFSSDEWGRDRPDGLKAQWTADKKREYYARAPFFYSLSLTSITTVPVEILCSHVRAGSNA
jgi:hypothetical protein